MLHTTQRKKKKEKKATLGVLDMVASFFILLLKALDMREAKRRSWASRIPEKTETKTKPKNSRFGKHKTKVKAKTQARCFSLP